EADQGVEGVPQPVGLALDRGQVAGDGAAALGLRLGPLLGELVDGLLEAQRVNRLARLDGLRVALQQAVDLLAGLLELRRGALLGSRGRGHKTSTRGASP